MRQTSRQLKYQAKESMKGHTGMLILASVLVVGANWLSSSLASAFFDGESTLSIILGMVFEFILNLLVGIFSAGLSYLMLNISRRRDFSYGDLFYFFRNQPDRVIVAGFVLALLQIVSGIPLYVVTYAVPMGNTAQELLDWMSLAALAMLAETVLNLLLTLPFVLTYYCLADDLELEGIQALKESLRLMKGNKWRYLRLQISFFPILFLSVFTLYLALLWIVPYMEMTSVSFYRDILGEYDGSGGGYLPQQGAYPGGAGRQVGSGFGWNQSPGGQNRPDGSGFGWNQDPDGADERPRDDYNSEA